MAIISRSITMPEELFKEIDATAARMYTNRSQLIIRVWQEWKQDHHRQQRLPIVETSSDSTPTSEMRANGASPLFSEAI